ncbi:hypothetical protein L1887_35382 [Cichorium endivia]|nr:hypothetical protein L1887_35382 [Cichorium endivia]
MSFPRSKSKRRSRSPANPIFVCKINTGNDVIGPDNVILIPESPLRNAFLLTRSRSAPYRSSSLASKFWESTMEETWVDTEVHITVRKMKDVYYRGILYKKEMSMN